MSRLPAGGKLGRYEIERMLGAGAMGEVYLAEDPQIGRRVAIKTVRVEEGKPAEVEERKRRLIREARAAGRLLHPHVVALFDVGEDQGVLYLAFECVEGMDLAQRLEQEPPVTLREALSYVRQAAEGLEYAHRQGIVHRDIKPSNLLLGPDGRVKVSDFGIAKLAEQTSDLTMTGSVVGSPHYLSPEQIRGDELDGRSDIFSLGVLFYEILSRSRPFEGETLTTLVYQILHRDPPSIAVSRPELGTRLESVLQRMLQKDRDQRFATAGEVARALALCESELPAAVLDRPASPSDAPPLDGTRRMSTSERAVKVQAGSPGAAIAASPTAMPTDLLPTKIQSRDATDATSATAARPSRTGLWVVAAIVAVVLLVLVVGGLAARRWAASLKKEVAEIAAAPASQNAPAEAAKGSSTASGAQPLQVASAAPRAPEPERRRRSRRHPRRSSRRRARPLPRHRPSPRPARHRSARRVPPRILFRRHGRSRRRRGGPRLHDVCDTDGEADAGPNRRSPSRSPSGPESSGDRPRRHESGMALSFDVEPPEAIVQGGTARDRPGLDLNAKKKDGRAYDLPEAGEHIVQILAEGKTYALRVIASPSASLSDPDRSRSRRSVEEPAEPQEERSPVTIPPNARVVGYEAPPLR
ncbi:MAG: serine/threonine-protein kinase [Thermoanaerobaculia bacterium]